MKYPSISSYVKQTYPILNWNPDGQCDAWQGKSLHPLSTSKSFPGHSLLSGLGMQILCLDLVPGPPQVKLQLDHSLQQAQVEDEASLAFKHGS